jgi:hypothetical protein
MEKSEAWRVPHEEAVGELGPIRFAERMPRKYLWVAIPATLTVISAMLMAVLVWFNTGPLPPVGANPKAARLAENQRTVNIAMGATAVGMCAGGLLLGFIVFRTALAGSYSLHEGGAMSIIWGKPARLRYQDVDELTMRGQQVHVNSAYVGAAQWVTLASSTIGGPAVRFCHVWGGSTGRNEPTGLAVITDVCDGIAAQIAERIDAALARGERIPVTADMSLTSEGVVVGKGSRTLTHGWAELDRLKIEGGLCSLYRRGEKKSVARWFFEKKNAMPVSIVIERRLSPGAVPSPTVSEPPSE